MIFRQNIETTNRLLAEMADDPDRGIKAYSLALISALAEGDDVIAPDSVLEAAASCKSIHEAVELYTTIRELRKDAHRRTPK